MIETLAYAWLWTYIILAMIGLPIAWYEAGIGKQYTYTAARAASATFLTLLTLAALLVVLL